MAPDDEDDIEAWARAQREEEQWVAERQAQREQRTATRRQQNMEAYHKVLELVEEIVQRHSQVLITKRRLKTYTSEYGVEMDRGWRSELGRFLEHVVINTLAQEGHADLVARAEDFAEDHGFSEAQPVAPLGVRLVEHMNTLIAELDSQRTERTPDEHAISTPAEYEQLCANLLSSAGWSVRVCGGSGDQGVDLVAERNGKRAVFQCKMHSKPVGNSAVQEVYTGMTFHNAHLAVVVSKADFTPGARSAAQQTGVVLLHHSQLGTFGENDHGKETIPARRGD